MASRIDGPSRRSIMLWSTLCLLILLSASLLFAYVSNQPQAADDLKATPDSNAESLLDVMSRYLSPSVRNLEAEQLRLQEQIRNGPPLSNRQQTGRLGFHSRPADHEFETQTVDITLAKGETVDSVVLVPARIDSNLLSDGNYGFPRRFRIEVSKDGEEFETICDESKADVPNRGFYPYQVHGRWENVKVVRIVATRLWPIRHRWANPDRSATPQRLDNPQRSATPQRWAWALGEVMVLSGDRNVAVGAGVNAANSFRGLPVWANEYLVDGQSILGMPVSAELSPTSGYLAAREVEKNSPKWIDVDLGYSTAIDEVRLIPARPTDYADRAGYGFPVRFRVVVSDDADFITPLVVYDQTENDFPNPGDNVVTFPVHDSIQGRYLRVEATELWDSSWKHSFALAELQVFSGNKNIAGGKPVSAKDVIGPSDAHGLWSPEFVVDGFSSQHRLISLSLWLEQIDNRRRAEDRLVAVGGELQNARANLLTMIGGLALLAITSLVALVFHQRRKQRLQTEALRKRIAGDLHDDIGSNLGSIALTSNLAGRQSSLSETAREDFERIRAVANETLISMRDLVWLIDGTQTGLIDLKERVQQTAAAMLLGIDYTVTVDGTSENVQLPLLARRHVYLSIKEILHNIARHANATHVTLEITLQRKRVLVRVHDNGKGFNPEESTRGHGLTSIQRRVASFHGDAKISSVPGDGTTIELMIPLT